MILVRKMGIADQVYQHMKEFGGEWSCVYLHENEWSQLLEEIDTNLYSASDYQLDFGIHSGCGVPWVEVNGVTCKPLPNGDNRILQEDMKKYPNKYVEAFSFIQR